MSIRPCLVSDLQQAPNLVALLDEYRAECGIPELGPADPQFATYRQIEAAGLLFALGAFAGDDLVGFALVLISDLPHFGKRVAVTESLFVAAAARKGGAGVRLLAAVEQGAKERGAVGVLVSAPVASRLATVMQYTCYREASRVFFRSLA